MASTDPVRPLAEFARPRMVAEPRNLRWRRYEPSHIPRAWSSWLTSPRAVRCPSSTSHATSTTVSPQSPSTSGPCAAPDWCSHAVRGRWVYCSISETALDAAHGFLDDLKDSIHRPHVADDCSPHAP